MRPSSRQKSGCRRPDRDRVGRDAHKTDLLALNATTEISRLATSGEQNCGATQVNRAIQELDRAIQQNFSPCRG